MKCFIVLEKIRENILALYYYKTMIIYYIISNINNSSIRPCFTQRKTHVY